jgi:thiol-disulfide isomerase/thioredoxin
MAKQPEKTFKQKAVRQFIEIGIIAVVAGALYFTGYHTEVIGTLQRGLLATGILRPNTTIDEADLSRADYNFPLYTLDGQRTSLAAFEGKTIFLNFWATWCPPCIAEMPNIQKLYNDFENDENVVFIMLSLDSSVEVVQKFMERKEFTMPVYFPVGRKPGVYDSSVVPSTYVISPAGDIVVKKRGMANYNTQSFREFLRSLSGENIQG